MVGTLPRGAASQEIATHQVAVELNIIDSQNISPVTSYRQAGQPVVVQIFLPSCCFLEVAFNDARCPSTRGNSQRFMVHSEVKAGRSHSAARYAGIQARPTVSPLA